MAVSPRNRKQELYSDFLTNLDISAINHDLLRVTNEEAVKLSIRNILMTDRGERLFQHNIGCDIRKKLFEPITPTTIIILKDLIQDALDQYEIRADVVDVSINGLLDSNEIHVTITFLVINVQSPIQVNLTFARVR